MDAIEFYIGELEGAAANVQSQLTLSGQAEIPRVRALVEAARNVIAAWDAENTPEPEDENKDDDLLPFDLHDDDKEKE